MAEEEASSLEGRFLQDATVWEERSVTLLIVDSNGQPWEGVIPECELVSDITGSRARGSVERRGQGRYDINYRPTVKGRHQLHVKVEGQHIRGSPFDILVKLPVKKLGAPMLSIGGVRCPWGVAINQRGEVVVTECDGCCVSVFSSSGERLRPVGTPGQFDRPTGVAVDGDNNILVVDYNNSRIQKFTSDGHFLTAVDICGICRPQFLGPQGITVNSSNKKVYVADRNNHRVQVLNSDLTFSSSFGDIGHGDKQFDEPCDVACDRSGNIYVVDHGNDRIQVFTAEEDFLRKFGGRGERKGELHAPCAVAVDANDRVYVTEQRNHRVSVFTCEGHSLFGRQGVGKGEFNKPAGIAVDDDGVLYVCDYGNHCIQLF